MRHPILPWMACLKPSNKSFLLPVCVYRWCCPNICKSAWQLGVCLAKIQKSAANIYLKSFTKCARADKKLRRTESVVYPSYTAHLLHTYIHHPQEVHRHLSTLPSCGLICNTTPLGQRLTNTMRPEMYFLKTAQTGLTLQ